MRKERWAAAAGVWDLWQGKDVQQKEKVFSPGKHCLSENWDCHTASGSLLCFCPETFNYYFSLDFLNPSSLSSICKNVFCRYKSRINHLWPSNMSPCVFLPLLLLGQPWAEPYTCYPSGSQVYWLRDLIFLWVGVCTPFYQHWLVPFQ